MTCEKPSLSSLFHLTLWSIAVAINVIFVAGENLNLLDSVNCSITTDNDDISDCTVFTNQTLILDCLHLPNGTWYKPPSSMALCPNSVCKLSQLSFAESRGLYYCQATPHKKYYVNVTVHGPPEFVSINNPIDCSSNICKYPLKAFDDSTYNVNISVKVLGIGPFNISWKFNYLQSEDDACNSNVNHKCSQQKISETESIFTYLLKNPLSSSMAGTYFALVSNDFGSNIAETKVIQNCNRLPSEPTLLSPQNNITEFVFKNQDMNISYSFKMNSLVKIGICYMNKDQSMKDIMDSNLFYSNCVLCVNDGICKTFQMSSKPNWIARRFSAVINIGDSCIYRYTIELQLKSLESSVMFGGFYKINNLGENNTVSVYYRLNVIGISLEAVIVMGCLTITVMVIVIIIILIILLKIVQKRQTKLKKEEKMTSMVAGGNTSSCVHDDSGICTLESDEIINQIIVDSHHETESLISYHQTYGAILTDSTINSHLQHV